MSDRLRGRHSCRAPDSTARRRSASPDTREDYYFSRATPRGVEVTGDKQHYARIESRKAGGEIAEARLFASGYHARHGPKERMAAAPMQKREDAERLRAQLGPLDFAARIEERERKSARLRNATDGLQGPDEPELNAERIEAAKLRLAARRLDASNRIQFQDRNHDQSSNTHGQEKGNGSAPDKMYILTGRAGEVAVRSEHNGRSPDLPGSLQQEHLANRAAKFRLDVAAPTSSSGYSDVISARHPGRRHADVEYRCDSQAPMQYTSTRGATLALMPSFAEKHAKTQRKGSQALKDAEIKEAAKMEEMIGFSIDLARMNEISAGRTVSIPRKLSQSAPRHRQAPETRMQSVNKGKAKAKPNDTITESFYGAFKNLNLRGEKQSKAARSKVPKKSVIDEGEATKASISRRLATHMDDSIPDNTAPSANNLRATQIPTPVCVKAQAAPSPIPTPPSEPLITRQARDLSRVPIQPSKPVDPKEKVWNISTVSSMPLKTLPEVKTAEHLKSNDKTVTEVRELLDGDSKGVKLTGLDESLTPKTKIDAANEGTVDTLKITPQAELCSNGVKLSEVKTYDHSKANTRKAENLKADPGSVQIVASAWDSNHVNSDELNGGDASKFNPSDNVQTLRKGSSGQMGQHGIQEAIKSKNNSFLSIEKDLKNPRPNIKKHSSTFGKVKGLKFIRLDDTKPKINEKARKKQTLSSLEFKSVPEKMISPEGEEIVDGRKAYVESDEESTGDLCKVMNEVPPERLLGPAIHEDWEVVIEDKDEDAYDFVGN